MKEVRVSKASAKDIEEIQRLYQQLDQYHVDIYPRLLHAQDAPRPEAYFQVWIDREYADFLLAKANGKVVGFLSVQKQVHPRSGVFKHHEYAMVDGFFVEAGYQGQGIGSKLMDAAVEWAKDRGVTNIQTSVWHDNASAQEFYKGRGFTPLTTRLELDLQGEPIGKNHG